MIIVSQDKDKIINFNTIQLLELYYFNDVNESDYCGIVAKNNVNDDEGLGLAVYETEERAKEVLQEITNYYQKTEIGYNGQFNYNPINAIYRPVYEMPKE